ncbi:MAG TPA: DUF47 family protein [Candidatus Scatomorpha intestinavium]|uniref:DUF47 family protein n=1 Tax=Candidatus Scatomorpha intestinavium TaxID=2840922 RepID=A0A9D0ZE02_9FIRM|nr:DUF47 family protein [Candidatus Scatomorpha intestinavium]
MSKKQDAYYFENFCECADYACKAAHLLRSWLTDFDPAHIHEKLDEMHDVEHAADEKKHEMLNVLARAFITPIEREDIILLSQNIDDLTDKIEDVLLRIYCNNIRSIRPDALKLIDVLIRSCGEVKEMLGCFSSFKNVKKLHEHVVNINTLEEEADALFIESLHELHSTCTDPLMVISWREIYAYLEHCVDACEHVADTVESVVMKNT